MVERTNRRQSNLLYYTNIFNDYKTFKKIYFNTYFQIGFFPKVYVQEHSQYTLKISNQIRI